MAKKKTEVKKKVEAPVEEVKTEPTSIYAVNARMAKVCTVDGVLDLTRCEPADVIGSESQEVKLPDGSIKKAKIVLLG